jgi:hypothetical protein
MMRDKGGGPLVPGEQTRTKGGRHASFKRIFENPWEAITHVAPGIFKQNFKLKCGSRITKVITWQHSFVNNILYENVLFYCK